MWNVSDIYKEKIKEVSRAFRIEIEIQHSKGVLFLQDRDIVFNSLTCSESTQAGENFSIGGAVMGDLKFTIYRKEEYEDIEFDGATVFIKIGLELSKGLELTYEDLKQYTYEELKQFTYGQIAGEWEYVPLGKFNIDEANKHSNTIQIKAVDNMVDLDKPYDLSKLSYPATLYQIYINACNVCNVLPATTSFPNMNHVVQERPEGDLTFRNVLGYVAELAGCFAKFNRNGALEIKWYKPSGLVLRPSNRFSFVPREDKLQIKGIMTTVDDTLYIVGNDEYAIDLSENPLLQGGYEEVLSNIYNNVKDTVFTPYESSWQGNPAVQAGDTITQIGDDGTTYNTLITTSIYRFGRAGTLSAKGLPEKSKGYRGSTNFKIAQVKRKIEKDVGDKLTTLEQAQLNAMELMANMLGGFAIPAEDAFYIADDKDISKAKNIWKWGIGGFGHSTNGVNGPYNTAITADGSIVAMLVAANIITANMVQTGILQSEDGSTWINLDNGAFNFKNLLRWVSGRLEVIDGDIYATNYQTGEKGAGTYIKLTQGGNLEAYNNNRKIVTVRASDNTGSIDLNGYNEHEKIKIAGHHGVSDGRNDGDYSAIINTGKSGLYLDGGGGEIFIKSDGSISIEVYPSKELIINGDVRIKKNLYVEKDIFVDGAVEADGGFWGDVH